MKIDSSMKADLRNAPVPVILRTAKDIVEDATKQSTLFKYERSHKLATFSHSELTFGKTIGRGGFCTVTEISSIKPPGGKKASWLFKSKKSKKDSKRGQDGLDGAGSNHGSIDETINGTDRNSKEYMSYRATHRGSPKYVIKRVAEEWEYQNTITFMKGVVDLAMETKFLSSLRHPNILECRGMAEGGPFSQNYFIILDKLYETFPKKLSKWTTTDRQCKGITGVFVGSKNKVTKLIIERLRVAFDVANALHYMHSVRVVYRDLKPDNLGFDSKGHVKLFDFGLAKELREDERTRDGLYKMTGFTGSVRYMAPEVGLKKPYNHTADIYSFSMLLWYILALEPPYGFYTPEMFLQRVFQQGHRPVVLAEWPENIQTVMKRGWDARLNIRPSFNVIMKVLRKEATKIDQKEGREFIPYEAPPLETFGKR